MFTPGTTKNDGTEPSIFSVIPSKRLFYKTIMTFKKLTSVAENAQQEKEQIDKVQDKVQARPITAYFRADSPSICISGHLS